MCDSFVQSACEIFGERVVVIDRYHVSKLYREPLDRLRISEMKRLKSILPHEEYTKLDNMMWIVRKKHECLSAGEKIKLLCCTSIHQSLKNASRSFKTYPYF